MPFLGSVYTTVSANGTTKVSVCVEHYLGKMMGVLHLPVKNEENGNPYGNSGEGKRNSSKNKDDQIKKPHNICIYIFFPKVAF